MTRPELNIAVAGQKSKASEYNENFDLMMDYVEEQCEGAVATVTNKANKDLSNVTGLTATITELNYTDGVTSAIQTQLDGKANTSLSNVNSTAKASIIAWGMPNYSAGISVSDNWTATADGWLRCQCDFAGWGTYVTLNGVKVSGVACLWTGDSSHWQSYNLIPVNAGQVVKFNGQSGYMEVQFYPMKGAN